MINNKKNKHFQFPFFALLFIMLLKTHINVPFQFKTQPDLLKIVKKSQPNIKDNILESK